MGSSKPVLVPWDFTKVAVYALEHALEYSKATNEKIILVHIVKKQKEIVPSEKKLEEKVAEVKKEHEVELDIIVREGSIFSSISDIAEEVNASLVIMGTHGVKGMQKITGSWALKVIANTEVPFVVVQAPPKSAMKNIVFPVDFRKEQKEKLKWAGYLVNHYKSKIHICYQPQSDARIKAKTRTNLVFSKSYLAEKGANFEIVRLDGKKSLADESIKLAKELGSNMILIMTTKNIGVQDYIFGADEQKIIANEEKIPVMCVNPKKGSKFGGFSSTGG